MLPRRPCRFRSGRNTRTEGTCSGKKDSIWAVRKEEGAVIKHIQIKDDLILLISENPAYEIETTSDPTAIIGRVVGVWQNLA